MSLESRSSRTVGSQPTRFTVDDVSPSQERLRSWDLSLVMREKLSREILVSPLAGRAVISDSGCPNPLVAAIHLAFSRHLPLTLSPDTIWLTIVQGFSHHVNENAEALRGRFVRHTGTETLTQKIRNRTVETIAKAVSGFSSQIREATDPAIHQALICDFSTTTPEIQTASEVALMDTYSHYFEYVIEQCICGIPHVSLTGTVDDWQRIRERVELLDTFGLEWWVSRLRPILDEFVRAAEGQPDRDFWRGIYKFRPSQGLYDTFRVTGWIVDLFPYLGDAPRRRRNHALEPDGNREVAAGLFPSGLCSVKVLLKLVLDDGTVIETQELDLVAGLLGIEQAEEDAALSPTISWCLAPRAPAPAPAQLTWQA